MPRSRLSLDDFLPYRLSFTSELVSNRVAEAYRARYDLTIPEWRLIAVIAEEQPMTQARIGQRTRMDKVTVSRAAASLSARGLIQRAPNAKDGRSHLLMLTQAGTTLYESIAPDALAMEKAIFSALSADEQATLHRLLRRIDRQVIGEDGSVGG
jgi:DNA-binding MarR family transcriptional regulator